MIHCLQNLFFFCAVAAAASQLSSQKRCCAGRYSASKKQRCRFSLLVEKNSGASAIAAEKTAALCPPLVKQVLYAEGFSPGLIAF